MKVGLECSRLGASRKMWARKVLGLVFGLAVSVLGLQAKASLGLWQHCMLKTPPDT